MFIPLRRWLGPLGPLLALMLIFGIGGPWPRLFGAETARRSFAIPAGDAEVTLEQFSEQAGVQIVYLLEDVRGVTTHPVKSDLAIGQALQQLVGNTGLRAELDGKTGAFVIKRAKSAAEITSDSKSKTNPTSPPIMKKNSTGWLPALLTLVTASSLPAQTVAKDEPVVLSAFNVSTAPTGRYQATEATSGSRVRISLLDSTQSVSVVTRDLIEDVGAGRILDAAKYVSGVYESTIPNAQDRTTVRGFQSDGATIDGFNYFSFSNVDPVLIDRLEVVKGPNAILAPQGVPGGTINLVSKKPTFTDNGSVTAQVGRYDANRAEVDVNRVLIPGQLAFRVVGAEQESENIAGGNFKNSTTVMPMFTYRFRPGTELTVQAQIFNSWGGAYGGLPIDLYVGTNDKAHLISTIPDDLDLYTTMAARHSSGQYYRLLFTSALTENFSVRLAANNTNFAGSSVGISIGNPVGTGLLVTRNEQTGAFAWNGVTRNDDPSFARSGSVAYQTRRAYNVQNDYVYDVKLDGFKSTTVAGFAIDYLKNPNSSVGFTMPNFTIRSFTVQPYTLTTLTSNQANYSKAQQVYVNETLSLLDDRLKINVGLARSEYQAYVTDGFRSLTSVNKPSATLPAAGLVFKPIKELALFAGYSKQATANGPSTTSILAAATQTSKQWEVGARVQLLDQRLYSSLTYFDIEQNNFGVPNPGNAAVPTPVPALPALLTNRLAHGVEFELTFVVTKNLSLVGNATVMKNRDTDGVPFRGTAEKSGAVWINYTADKGSPLQGWSVGVGLDYLAKRPGDLSQAFTSLSTPTNIIRQQPSFYLPARTLVSAKIGYRFDAHWKAQLNVDNALDENYLAASTARNTVFPGTPVNPRLSVTYGF